MDPRRRTLASDPATVINGAHVDSRIPMPSSAMKAQSTLRSSNMHSSGNNNNNGSTSNGPSRMRMSIAPGRMSTIGGSGGAVGAGNGMQGGLRESQQSASSGEMMTGGRRSTMNTVGSGSRADGGMYGRASSNGRASVVPPNTVRRSSSRQSLAPSAPMSSAVGGHNRIEDPRKSEYRSAHFQKICRDNIEEYLYSTGRFPHSLGPRGLNSPTQKEFQLIVQFLVKELDPSFVWGKSFESDCMTIMRDMRYPSPEQISKTSLGAAGGPTAWPALLAMLNWLVDLARALEMWQDPETGDPMVLDLDIVPEDYENFHARLGWEYLSKAYNQWEAGADEFPELEAQLQDIMYNRTDKLLRQMGDVESDYNRIETQLRMLTQVESPLKKASIEQDTLLGDKAKFEKYIDVLQERIDKVTAMNNKVKMAANERAATIQDLEEEKARLERQVAAQNLTPEEVKRMTVEHSTLKESIPDLQNKLADGNKQQGEQEIAVTRRMDDIETLSQEYNGLINKLGLASGQRTDFTIAVEMNQGDMTGVGVVSARMKEEIRPALQAFGDQVRSDYQKRANRKIELDDELDKVSSERQAKEEEQKTLEMKLRIADDQADKFRTHSQSEAHDMQERLTKFEKEVSAMSMSSQDELFRLESELESLRVERTETVHAVQNRRDKLSNDVTSHAQIILNGTDHVASKFAELKAFTQNLK